MAVPYYTSIVRPKRRRGAGERERKEWAGGGRKRRQEKGGGGKGKRILQYEKRIGRSEPKQSNVCRGSLSLMVVKWQPQTRCLSVHTILTFCTELFLVQQQNTFYLFGGCLETRCHVDVWTEITSIYLVF